MFAIAGHVVEFPGEWILKEIDIAKEMGVQAFLVDAGWYGDVFGGWTERRGDWWEGDWLPGGLAGIREHAHRQGLLFGLWLEPEAAGSLSQIAQEHPDWLLQTDDGRWPGNVRVLNLGKEEVARHFESEVLRIIGDHQLDFFKIDYNVRAYEGGENLRAGYLENETWRHMEVLYATFDRVRREMPNIVLENCAGGGGRLDLGMMRVSQFRPGDPVEWPNALGISPLFGDFNRLMDATNNGTLHDSELFQAKRPKIEGDSRRHDTNHPLRRCRLWTQLQLWQSTRDLAQCGFGPRIGSGDEPQPGTHSRGTD